MNGIKIRGMGHAVPSHAASNVDIAQVVDTSDEWILTRTGIRERRYCTEETSVQLGVEAAEKAIAVSGISPDEIGVCIVATLSPDRMIPATACMVQKEIGLEEDTLCYDLSAACSGFLFALHTTECLLNACPKKYGLVIGAEVLSRLLDWTDRGTCILFGDGAGAAVVECGEGWPSIGAISGSRGDVEALYVEGPGSEERSYIRMDGKKVFRFAVETIPKCMDQVLEKTGRTLDEIDFFVFHQANVRIIDHAVRKYHIPKEKYYMNIDRYGNTSAASIPLVLSELQEQGKVHSGSRVMLIGFGGGLTWGGAVIEFA